MSRRDVLAVLGAAGVSALSGSVLGPARAQEPSGVSAVLGPIDIPRGTWVARHLPPPGGGIPGGSKHTRWAFNPDDQRLYACGGDYSGPGGLASGRNEVWAYSVGDDRWTLAHPYCAEPEALQASHPDEVGWCFDTRRRHFWMVPGYMGEAQGQCEARLVRGRVMHFHPATREWRLPAVPPPPTTGTNTRFAVYDPAGDQLVRLRFDGGSGLVADHFAIAENRWETVPLPRDVRGRDIAHARLGAEYAALDAATGFLYAIEPVRRMLLRYNVRLRTMRYLGRTPAGGSYDSAMPVWDSVNQVLLWPQVTRYDTARVVLRVYDPRGARWHVDPMDQPDRLAVRGNAAVFDPRHAVLVLLGGLVPPNPYLFLYRYAPGSAA